MVVSPQVWKLIQHVCKGRPTHSSSVPSDHSNAYVQLLSISTTAEQGAMCQLVVQQRQAHRQTLCTPTPAMENAFKCFVPAPV